MPEERTEQKYDRVAAVYDRRWRRYVQPTLNYFTEALALRGDERLLDASCGTGTLIVRLREHHPELDLTGVDLSYEMLREAREKIGTDDRVTLRQGNAEDLPFEEAAFEVVVSTSAFHYYGHPGQALSEFRRVLRPGGRLAMMDWNGDHWLWQLLDPLLRRFDPTYRGCYGVDTMHELLHAAGFRDINVKPVHVGWIWGMWYASGQCPR